MRSFPEREGVGGFTEANSIRLLLNGKLFTGVTKCVLRVENNYCPEHTTCARRMGRMWIKLWTGKMNI